MIFFFTIWNLVNLSDVYLMILSTAGLGYLDYCLFLCVLSYWYMCIFCAYLIRREYSLFQQKN